MGNVRRQQIARPYCAARALTRRRGRLVRAKKKTCLLAGAALDHGAADLARNGPHLQSTGKWQSGVGPLEGDGAWGAAAIVAPGRGAHGYQLANAM